MTKIYVDDKEVEVKEGQNLLHAALSHGYDVPYFCWHPSLGSVGACRQCAVVQYRDVDDKKGRLVMSCMTPVTEGARFSIECDDAKSFRASVIEWLMTNHPHDCPVCDEGGECHLQDMTLMSGHNYRRYRFNKRTHKNQNLGPLINHEMNRCITCYRCVRFYRDVAGGTDLGAFSSSQNVYFGRAEDGFLESEFSGNLAEVCPTGVFTDKRFQKNYTRKWDLQVAPSICQMCSLGCNITPSERNGVLRRVQNRFHSQINGYFICDRGRFGHDYVNSPDRILVPLERLNKGQPQREKSLRDALHIAREKIRGAGRVRGIGSPRASVESNFALRKLVGPENFYSSENTATFECTKAMYSKLASGIVSAASLKEIEEADAVIIFGEDITNTAPMMAFSVRQIPIRLAQKTAESLKIPDWNDSAVRNFVREKNGPIYNLQVAPTKLDEIANQNFYVDPFRMERIAFGIAHQIDPNAPCEKKDMGEDQSITSELVTVLIKAKNPVIIAGVSLGSKPLIDAIANIAQAMHNNKKDCQVAFIPQDVNSLGLHILEPKASAETLFDKNVEASSVIISLENEALSETAGYLVALDYLNHKALARADLVLPVASFAEGTGSVINNEGRAQRFYPPIASARSVDEAWKYLRWLSSDNTELDFCKYDDLSSEIVEEVRKLAPYYGQMRGAEYRVCGQKIPRAPSEQSGRTAVNANKTMHEPMPKQDNDSPYAFSMEGARVGVNGAETAVFWAPRWNSVQALNKFQDEVAGPLKGGPTGVRLFSLGRATSTFSDVTKSQHDEVDGFYLVWRRNIYRSSMASHSQALMQCPSMSAVLISETDARDRNLNEGDLIEFTWKSADIRLPCKIKKEVPKGWLVVPEELG